MGIIHKSIIILIQQAGGIGTYDHTTGTTEYFRVHNNVEMEGSKNARERRASLDDAESDLMASSSSLFSELSWEGDCDRETVARHLGMTGKSLQDYLEYQKKDDTSSLSSASTTKCADGIDSSSADGAGSSPGSGHRMRHRASIRGSIVSLSGTVLESIQECDRSSDEDTALQSRGASVTFVKFEPSADDASNDYGSEESLRVDELFDAAGSDGDANAKSSTGVNEGVSKTREEEEEEEEEEDDDDEAVPHHSQTTPLAKHSSALCTASSITPAF